MKLKKGGFDASQGLFLFLAYDLRIDIVIV